MVVDRVTAETASDLVIEPALGHPLQRKAGHKQRAQIRIVAHRSTAPAAQQALDAGGVGELRRPAKAAMSAVKIFLELFPGLVQQRRRRQRSGVIHRRDTLEYVANRAGLLADLVTVLPIIGGDTLQNLAKGGHTMARTIREIGAAKERRVIVRRQEHGQRPAAGALDQQLMGELVDLVQVRPFFPVYLDVDKQLVHQRRGSGVLERLMGHHVTPVTGRVAHRQQDRLVFFPRPVQGFRAPWIPVHRVIRMLQQIRAGLGSKMVGGGGHGRSCEGELG